jgi:Ca2+-dependent lipid-binding protein
VTNVTLRYHNAGIIVFTVLATHFITLFRFGWGWIIIVFAFCSSYYSLSTHRTRRNIRDDLSRELAKTELVKAGESVEWMNNFLAKFWLIYEPILSKSIILSVDQVLSVSTPAFLDSMKLSDFTLGSKAPRIQFVKSHVLDNNDPDEVVMDWKIAFVPHDTTDKDAMGLKNKSNTKVVLKISVGKGLLVAGKDIVVQDISFIGLMRVRLK